MERHPNSQPPVLIRILKHGFLFLLHATIVILTIAFTTKYVDGHPFHYEHHFNVPWGADEPIHKVTYSLIQSEVTTVINLLASAARTVSNLWVGAIDLRCIIFVLERGGITLEGLKTMSDGLIPIPGIHQLQWKTNLIILVILHVVLVGSSFLSSVLTGSITWNPGKIYITWNDTIPQDSHPAGGTFFLPGGDYNSTWNEQVMRNLMGTYFRLWDDNDRDTMSLRRVIPVKSFPPIGSRVDNVTIPYFAVDAFEWITDPSFTLTQQQILTLNSLPAGAPQEMANGERWGLIPDGQWGHYNIARTEPHSISESRIFVTSYSPYFETRNTTDTFTFANVTYRAGAARCGDCRVYSPGKVKDYGDFKDLELIGDPVTTLALAVAPYLGMAIYDAVDLKITSFPSKLRNEAIEILSHSYQLAWGGIWSAEGREEMKAVQVAVDATIASVTIWRVAVWGSLHAMVLIFGILFRHLNMRGDHQWTNNLGFAALLVDPTPFQRDMDIFAEDTPDIQVARKLERDTEKREYIIITQSRRSKANPESTDSAIGNKTTFRSRQFFRDSSATDLSALIPLETRRDLEEKYNNEAWDSRYSDLISPFEDDRTSSPVGHSPLLAAYGPYDGYSWVSQQLSGSLGSVGLARSGQQTPVDRDTSPL